MSLHTGKKYTSNNITLGLGNLDEARKNNPINHTDLEWDIWREKAVVRNDIYYFSIYYKESVVGEIFLHDINTDSTEALVGYHIFNPNFRGKGIGTTSLKLLQKFVKESEKFKKLTIITAEDNIPSKKISEKCGFKFVGSSWEDSKMAVYEWIVK